MRTSKFKKIVYSLLALLIVVAGVNMLYSFRPGWMPYKKYFPGNDYPGYWAKVDSLERLGLTESASKEVDIIFEMAHKDNNTPQVIKALLHRMKYRDVLEEESFRTNFAEVNAEIDKASSPLKEILWSIRGQMLWSYYTQNRYRYTNRTNITNMKLDDVMTWDLSTIVKETIRSYENSLNNPALLKSVPLSELEAILENESGTRFLRPTLYDFLSNRALDFFAGSEPDLTKPAETFELNKAEYFGKGTDFKSMNVVTPDSLATKFYAVKILQDLLRFHENDVNRGAYVDADIRRLNFVRSYSTLANKDALYLQALEELKGRVGSDSAFTQVSYQIASFHSEKAATWSPFIPDQKHKDDYKKALAVCEEAISKYPQSYGGLLCASLRETILAPTLQVSAEHGNPTALPFKLRLSYKNTEKVYMKIVMVDYFKFRQDTRETSYNTEEMVSYLLAQKQVREGSTSLRPSDDHQMHSTELPLQALGYGYYYVLLSDNPDFSLSKGIVSYTDLWVSDIAPLIRSSNNYAETELFISNRTTGMGIAKATVNIFREEYNYTTRKYEFKKVTSLKTDKQGYIRVPELNNDSYSYLSFEVIAKKDRYVSHSGIYQYRSYESDGNVRTTHLFLDRGIYRPGQTVHFKGLVTETRGKDTKILPNTDVKIALHDANGQQKSTLDVKTNAYGTYSGSFTIPQGELTGQWYLQDNFGYAYFSVEEYKRPKFEVTFDTLKGNYRLNEQVTVKGIAKSYAGYGIDGATVSYRVTRNVNYPYWWSYYYYPLNNNQQQVAKGTATTDDKGNFTLSFTALPDNSVDREADPYFTYTVNVDVTDITGETRSGATYVYAGYKSMLINLGLPEQLGSRDTNRYLLSTTNLAGTPTPAKGTLTITRVNDFPRLMRQRNWEQVDQQLLSEGEYVKLFPNDVYGAEDQVMNLPKGEVIATINFDTQNETFLRAADVQKLTPGRYLVQATSTDPYGEKVNFEKYLVVYELANGKCPVNQYQWIVPVKTYCEPGEKAQFLVGSGAKNVNLLYEIEFDKKIIYKEYITLNGEQRLIEIPVKEEYRGNFAVHFSFVRDNRSYTQTYTVSVPFSNRELDLKFITFRDKLLPGQQEEWKIAVSGPNKEQVAAELLASMYDASLDAFRSNYWYLDLNSYYYQMRYWQGTEVNQITNGYGYTLREYITTQTRGRSYDNLRLFGSSLIDPYMYSDHGYYYRFANEESVVMDGLMTTAPTGGAVLEKERVNSFSTTRDETKSGDKDDNTLELSGGENGRGNLEQQWTTVGVPPQDPVKPRSNFEETAFFYPHLETNEKGEFIFSFKIPESLTTWKFQGLAHTKDLKVGRIEKTVVTQKDLMITAFAPRFLREGDQVIFTAKVTNLSDHDLNGEAELQLADALSGASVNTRMGLTNVKVPVAIKKGESTKVSWKITVPSGLEAVRYTITATAGAHSDGEEMTLPVLLNSMLVTESLPLPINGISTKNFKFEKLLQSGKSNTLRHHRLTLEFTSNPAWYAVQALPYMMEYPYECSEQTFNRMYANSIASHIANSDPKIKRVFDTWKNYQPNALLSNLEKNQELKAVMLQETPWVMDAKNETERKRRIAVLFDLNRMQNELARCVRKLSLMQVSNGGWPWFEGGPDDRYITQYIISGFGHLRKIGIATDDATVTKMVNDGVGYLDNRIREDYENLLRYKVNLEQKNISSFQIQYLYARSYFRDIEVAENNKTAFNYFLAQAKKYWVGESIYMKGMLALVIDRYGDKKLASDIIRSIKENSITNEEMGMYWKQSVSWYWYEAPIETQALLIEAFDEVTDDQVSVEKMKVWLLKNKQTNEWKTTKATSEACYALLLKGTSQLSDDALVVIQLGNMTIDPTNDASLQKEAGTGYFKTAWDGASVTPDMGNVKVTKSTKGVAWGAVYWQYFEQLDKITPASTPIKITKKLFRQTTTDRGLAMELLNENVKLHIGDRVKVRVEITVDRPMDYVHLKDMRASAFEPENVFSGYRFQDGLYYYEATRDAATNFFIDHLPKGTFVFEYPVRVTHEGDFSNGITTIQCMYAPEFTSHSEGLRVHVGD